MIPIDTASFIDDKKSDFWEMMKTLKPSQIKALYSPNIESAKDAEKIGKGAKELVGGGSKGKVVGAAAQYIAEYVDNKGSFPTSFLDNTVKNAREGFVQDIKSGDFVGSAKNAGVFVVASWFDYCDLYTSQSRRYMTGVGLDMASDTVKKINQGFQAASKYIPEEWGREDIKSFVKTSSNVIRNTLTGLSCFYKYYM